MKGVFDATVSCIEREALQCGFTLPMCFLAYCLPDGGSI